MAEVKILVQGYAQDGELAKASATAVLILEKDVKIVVDPGINKDALAAGLQKENLKPEDIDYVLITHYHPDHAFGAAWFPQAKLLDNENLYDGDLEKSHDGFIPGTELAIMHTPGHSPEHCSLVVPTDKGMVVVGGDVFWWYDSEEQKIDINKPDSFAQDQKVLAESRKKVLKLADFIVPGHGRIIKVK